MVLKDIMTISGQPGLFRFIAQGKNAIIVEHLETKKRSSAFSSAKVSSLEEITVFTEEEDMPLGKVFDLIHEKENGGPAIDYKTDPEKLKLWFEGILPNYNKDKVYVSHIKKIAQWYNILQKLNLLIKEEPEKIEEQGKNEETFKTEQVGETEGSLNVSESDKKEEAEKENAGSENAEEKKETESGSAGKTKDNAESVPGTGKKKPKSGGKINL